MLAVGEVRTGLLQSSRSMPPDLVRRALGLIPGERVRSSQRPIAYAVSPDRLTGLDCRLATRSGARPRGVGTAVTRATVTGGRVLQGSTRTVLVRGGSDRRLPWWHYLARPGVVETTGRAGWADLADGFLGSPQPSTLDLGAPNERILDDIVVRPELDRRPPFRARRTTLRWVASTAEADGDGPVAHFAVRSETLRTARLALPAGGLPADDLPAVVEWCEDVALHDWLLTTLIEMVDRSGLGGVSGAAAVRRLRPAVDHLLHLWMPAARVDRRLLPLWEWLERRPGFTRQWDVSVNRIRDQIAVTTVGLLGDVAEGDADR
jgi:hypothetical protein